MNKYLYLLATSFLFFACKNEKPKDADDTKAVDSITVTDVEPEITSPEIKEIPSLRKCYTLNEGGTEAELNLVLEDDLVTGELQYYGENPKNGTVTGEFSGDTLILTCKYNKNNTTLVEEVALLENSKNYTLQMGTAEIVEKDGIKTIEDKSEINFDGPIFKKYDCEQEKI